MLEETQETEEIIQRVAALDVGKAELGVTRVVMEVTSDYWRGSTTCWKPTGWRFGW